MFVYTLWPSKKHYFLVKCASNVSASREGFFFVPATADCSSIVLTVEDENEISMGGAYTQPANDVLRII